MRKNDFLFTILLLALLGFGWWVLGRPTAAGPVAGAPRQLDPSPTAPPLQTEPPGPGYTPTPTATLWLDAPYNSYAQPIYKPEATPTPTQVPGTATFAPPLPTEPPPPTQEGDPTGTVAPPPTVSPTPTLEGGPTATVAPPPTVLPTEEPG